MIEAVIYGDPTLCTKLAKRLVCGVRDLPLRLRLNTVTDTQAAIEAGATHDPSLFINGKLFIGGLVASETMTQAMQQYLLKESQ
ncbi:MAG: hypothetical protein IE918_04905 [Campylobacterales bacterium]|nr:hypothetical protein [Campylobacterales bacterium]